MCVEKAGVRDGMNTISYASRVKGPEDMISEIVKTAFGKRAPNVTDQGQYQGRIYDYSKCD